METPRALVARGGCLFPRQGGAQRTQLKVWEDGGEGRKI